LGAAAAAPPPLLPPLPLLLLGKKPSNCNCCDGFFGGGRRFFHLFVRERLFFLSLSRAAADDARRTTNNTINAKKTHVLGAHLPRGSPAEARAVRDGRAARAGAACVFGFGFGVWFCCVSGAFRRGRTRAAGFLKTGLKNSRKMVAAMSAPASVP
jgi:hypothetical protein